MNGPYGLTKEYVERSLSSLNVNTLKLKTNLVVRFKLLYPSVIASYSSEGRCERQKGYRKKLAIEYYVFEKTVLFDSGAS